MTTFRKPLKPLPKPCPVCIDKRMDKASIAEHNIIASQTGCRSYGNV